MSRISQDEIKQGIVRNGFDYDLQVWVKDYIITLAGSTERTAELKGQDLRKVKARNKLTQQLAQFTGTENYYKHWLGKVYTDGVKFLAEQGQCYWLLDAIFSYRRAESFQIWTLEVREDKTAVLTMKEDTDEPIKVKQELTYTDFPMDKISLWLIDGVLILPSEY